MAGVVTGAARRLWTGLCVVAGATVWWFKEFNRHRGFQHAAAMSYFAALSFIPLIVLLASAFGYALALMGPEYGGGEDAFVLLRRAMKDIAPFASDIVETRLRALMEARDTVGALGVVFLFVSSSLMFGAVEMALREIFERRRRKILVSRLLFILFLLFLAVLGISAHALRVMLGSWIDALGDMEILITLTRYPGLDWLLSFVILGGGFCLMIVYFGRRQVKSLALAEGAIMFYALFVLSRWLFGLYIRHLASFDIAYGSLATVVTAFVWIFYGATVFLLCAEFVRLMDGRIRRREGSAGEVTLPADGAQPEGTLPTGSPYVE